NNSDCNDNQLQYLDADGDGFGSNTKVACGVTNNTDCNDAQVLYADADGDGFGSTVKVACGGVANNSDCNDNQLQYLDADGDGFGSNTKVACGVTNNFDCNDSQSQYLDADGDGFGSNTKVACGVTNNTDCNDAQILYADADGDGFGSAVKVACGGVANNSDCNDAQIRYQDNDVDGFGSTVKVACGGVTNNSDCNDALTLYADLDGDGFGSNVKVACIGVPNKTDCNDFAVFYQDLDGDGFGSNVKVACGTVTNSSDCNDSQLQYQDFDGDGFGSTVKVACGVTNSSDCNDNQFQYLDADGDGFGSNIKVACGVSNHSDCNDALLLYADADGDGYGSLVKVACGIANNSDCDDTKATIHPGAVEIGYNLIDEDCDGLIDEGFPPKSTVLTGPQCNTALQAIDSQLIADLVAGAQGYQWRVTALTGPNAGQVQFLNTLLRVMKLTQLGTYAYATTYKVEVAVYYAGFLQPYTASNCTVTTPVITTSLMNCSQTLLTMSEVIYANNVPYATGYRFRISDGVNTTVLDRSVREFRMNLITAFQPKFGRQYTVEISVRNTDGVYLPYGAPCTVNTPVFPTTSVQDSQCDDFSPENTGVIIYATSYPGAIAYVFNLSGPALPEQGIEVLRNTRSFKLSDFSGLVPGATYNVRVRLIFNYSDIPGPYGKICTVVVPGSSRMMHVPFTAVAYPNPFSDSFNLNVTTSADSRIAIRIYDMTGRLLESRSTEASSSKTLTLGSEFPSGVYNVIISQGDETKTIRMIKR
ncbi:MAG: T9SS type A sorting domain-containing protein, partial [Flavobacterium sp.]